MSESMKIRNLKNYVIPSHIVNIWEKDYPPYLLPLQEDAVRNYEILDYNGCTGLPRRSASRNDKKGAPRNDGERLPSPLSRGQAYYASRNDERMDSCFRGNDRGRGKEIKKVASPHFPC